MAHIAVRHFFMLLIDAMRYQICLASSTAVPM